MCVDVSTLCKFIGTRLPPPAIALVHMDAPGFARLVDHGQKKSKSKESLSWPTAACKLAATLDASPDGITEPVLLSTISMSKAAAQPLSALARIKLSRRVEPLAVISLALKASSQPGQLGNVEVLDADGQGPSLLLAPTSPLRAAPRSLLRAGRRLRATRCAVTECVRTMESAEQQGPLLLLPCYVVAVVLDADADAELIRASKQSSRVRGQDAQRWSAPGAPPLVLRVLSVAAPEVHNGKSLRRLLLELDAASIGEYNGAVAGEIEAELLLWDDAQQALLELLPLDEHPLLLIANSLLLTTGSGDIGGAAAQLAINEETLICLVEEADVEAPQPHGAHGQPQPKRTKSLSKAAPPSYALLCRLLAPPARCASGVVHLLVHNGESQVAVELIGSGAGAAEAAAVLCAHLRPGHHLLITKLALRPAAPSPLATWGGGQQQQQQQQQCPMTSWRGSLGASSRHGAGASAPWISVQWSAALRLPSPGAGQGKDGGAEAELQQHAVVHNLSCMRAALRSPLPIGVTPAPLGHAASNTPVDSIVCAARLVALQRVGVSVDGGAADAGLPVDGRSWAEGVRVTLEGSHHVGAGFTAAVVSGEHVESAALSLLTLPNLTVSLEVVEEVCDVTWSELATMDARTQSEYLSVGAERFERAWALTREGGGGGAWRVNACARLQPGAGVLFPVGQSAGW